jgi:hypothetical protein
MGHAYGRLILDRQRQLSGSSGFKLQALLKSPIEQHHRSSASSPKSVTNSERVSVEPWFQSKRTSVS